MSSSTSETSGDYRKKVYTKFGDSGETSLLYGGRISKNSPNTEAYGITDEAVSVMGLARAFTSDERVNNMLRQLLDTLSYREAEILKFRFGLDGGDVRTLEEVGAEFGVTRERVRQVQNIALGRMRRMIEKVEKYEHH